MFEKLQATIAEELSVDAEAVTREARFAEDLKADSLDLFQMVMKLEDDFGVEIPTEDLEHMTTVGDVEAYLKAKGIE